MNGWGSVSRRQRWSTCRKSPPRITSDTTPVRWRGSRNPTLCMTCPYVGKFRVLLYKWRIAICAYLMYTEVSGWLPTRVPQPSHSSGYCRVSRRLVPTDKMSSSTNRDLTEKERMTYGDLARLPRWADTCLGSHRHIQGSL